MFQIAFILAAFLFACGGPSDVEMPADPPVPPDGYVQVGDLKAKPQPDVEAALSEVDGSIGSTTSDAENPSKDKEPTPETVTEEAPKDGE